MEKHTLTAKKRILSGRKVKRLRKQGILPANIYGKKVKSQAIEISLKDFDRVYSQTGETGLIELHLDTEARPVLIHNVQYDPVHSFPLHADFFQVSLKEKVTTKVPVELVGESPAVVNKVGVLLTLISEIEVEALPADLPDKIIVDVRRLTDLDQLIKISDIKVSDKVVILTPSETTLLSVAPLVSKEAEKMVQEEEAAKAAAAAETVVSSPESAEDAQNEVAPQVSPSPKKEQKT